MLKIKTKSLAAVFFAVVIFATIILVSLSIRNASNRNNHIPLLGVETTTICSNNFILGSTQSQYTIIFLFNPDCDLCLLELEGVIIEHKFFDDKELNFISFAEMEILNELHNTFNLDKHSHIQLLSINAFSFPEKYIDYPNPSVIVYDQSGDFLLEHRGYCSPEALIAKIRNHEN